MAGELRQVAGVRPKEAWNAAVFLTEVYLLLSLVSVVHRGERCASRVARLVGAGRVSRPPELQRLLFTYNYIHGHGLALGPRDTGSVFFLPPLAAALARSLCAPRERLGVCVL